MNIDNTFPIGMYSHFFIKNDYVMYSLPNLNIYYCSNFLNLVGWITYLTHLSYFEDDPYEESFGGHVT